MVQLDANLTEEGQILLSRTTGYRLGSEPISDPETIEKLDAYFAQLFRQGKVRWTPDIFHTLGLY